MDATIGLIIYILFVHYIADFILQTDWMAKGKSKSYKILTQHILEYTGVSFCLIAPLCLLSGITINNYVLFGINILAVLLFVVLNGLAHWIVDAITSVVVSRLFSEGKTHSAFAVIGFDQFIHVSILICTLRLILLE